MSSPSPAQPAALLSTPTAAASSASPVSPNAAAQQQQQLPRSVVVGNVSPQLTADVLQQFFQQIGPVVAMRPLGPGQYLVVFDSAESAAGAALLTGTPLLGQRLLIALADPAPRAAAAPPILGAAPIAPVVANAFGAAAVLELQSSAAEEDQPRLPATVGSNSQKAEEVARTVYVGNISAQVSVDLLMKVFGTCGGITFCRMAGDEAHPARFAFVEFERPEGAAAALRLNGLLLIDRPLKVNHSKNPIVKPAPKPAELRKEREAKEKFLELTRSISKKLSGDAEKESGEGAVANDKKESSRDRSASRSRSRSPVKRRSSRSRSRSRHHHSSSGKHSSSSHHHSSNSGHRSSHHGSSHRHHRHSSSSKKHSSSRNRGSSSSSSDSEGDHREDKKKVETSSGAAKKGEQAAPASTQPAQDAAKAKPAQ